MAGLEWHTWCDRSMYAPTEGWIDVDALKVEGDCVTDLCAIIEARREGDAGVGEGWEYTIRYESPAKGKTVRESLPDDVTYERAVERLREMFAETEGREAWMWEGTREEYAKEMAPNE